MQQMVAKLKADVDSWKANTESLKLKNKALEDKLAEMDCVSEVESVVFV